MTLPHVFLHIGLHKTGTSAFQAFVNEFRADLARQGCAVYEGLLLPRNHVDLHVVCLREQLDTLPRRNLDIGDIHEFEARLKRHIDDTLRSTQCSKVIFSAEGLSYLRYEDECEALKSLFPPGTVFTILLMLRDKTDFLNSYKREIRKQGWSFSDDPHSVLYVNDDSWLVDFEKLLATLRSSFDDVRVLDYEPNRTVPVLLAEVGVSVSGAEETYLINVSPGRLGRAWLFLKRQVKRLIGRGK